MKQFDEIIKQAKNVSLTSQEKALMRTNIISQVRENPIQSKQHIVSPYFAWFQIVRQHGFATALVLLFSLVGISGVSAEGTLPGDPLYGIKTGLNEKVLGFFAQSKDARAQWQLTLADRRLEESETLAKENKLTPEMRTALQSAFTNYTSSALDTKETDTSDHRSESNARMMKAVIAPKATGMNVSLMSTGEALPEEARTTISKVATTTITKEKIESLRAQVKRAKKKVETDRDALIGNQKFIQVKGNVLMTQKLIFDSEEALKSGNPEEAQKLYEDAEHKLDSNDSNDSSIKVENSIQVQNPLIP